MRLVIWNCWGGLDSARATRLAELQPDVAVVCEAGDTLLWPEDLDEPTSFVWKGSNPSKGLATLSFGDWTLTPFDEPPRCPWVSALTVAGPRTFQLLAVWTVEAPDRPGYTAQVAEAISAYRAELASGAMVLAGDLNCSPQTANPHPHLANVSALQALGLDSAYHLAQDLDHGEETEGTLYWRWSRDAPFHCDLAFIPATWRNTLTAARVGSYTDWVEPRVSDHVPLIIDVDPVSHA